jgi:putative ATPase
MVPVPLNPLTKVIFASEDVGLVAAALIRLIKADSSMLSLAVSTFTATQQCGMPESRIMLSHCCIQLALAKKSRASYNALGKAAAAIEHNVEGAATAPVPLYCCPVVWLR